MPRLRDVVRQTEEMLEQKEVELRQAAAARELLLRKQALLETILDEQAATSLLQRLTVKALSMARRPPVVYPDTMGAPSASAPSIDALPETLLGWDGALLQRVACMSISDGMQVYRSFLNKAQPMVVHAICHGTASPSYNELCRVTRQYANFLLLHGMVLNPEYERYAKMNLETGERDCVPPGWFERVGKQLPPHKGLARLSAVALSLAKSVDYDGLASLRDQVANEVQKGELVRMNALLEDYDGVSKQPSFLYRCQVMAYVLISLLHMDGLPLHEVSMLFCSCWPFTVMGTNVLVGYLSRPDVEAILHRDEAAAAGGSGGAGKQPGQSGAAAGTAAGASAPAQQSKRVKVEEDTDSQ